MNKIKHIILLLVCSFGLMISQFSNATIITNSCVSSSECSLDELINGGGSISIDDVAFTNWQEIAQFRHLKLMAILIMAMWSIPFTNICCRY